MNSGPNDMTTVLHRGTILPIRKAEVPAWNRLSAAVKDGYTLEFKKMLAKNKVAPDLAAEGVVTLFKKK